MKDGKMMRGFLSVYVMRDVGKLEKKLKGLTDKLSTVD